MNSAISAAVQELDYLAICGLILSGAFNEYAMIFRIKQLPLLEALFLRRHDFSRNKHVSRAK